MDCRDTAGYYVYWDVEADEVLVSFLLQHFIPKYSRYEKRHKNLSAHASPAFRIEVGDTVTVG